jgi:hypothetical protein
MFGDSSAITHPFGISVFGSTLLRVPPDSVVIRAAITRLDEKPSEAFAKACHSVPAKGSGQGIRPVENFPVTGVSLRKQ